MKKIQFKIFLLIIFISFSVTAQVGIGTATPNAQLDIPATNAANPSATDGILIPRISVFPSTNPTAAQNGMLVFLSNAIGANQPGFYYWNNLTASWLAVGSTLTNNWNLLGNAGTSPSTNFLGTTDNQDVVFKRNNVQAGFIGNPNITTGNMNTVFGANSLITSSGIRNTAVGSNVLTVNTSGLENTSVGDQSMFKNISGTQNTALGVGALYSNTTGGSNTALGRNALTANTTGENNTAVGLGNLRKTTSGKWNTSTGYGALLENTTGSYNTAFGYLSLNKAVTGNANVALGYQAGFNELGSNKLYIENSNADAVNALIYGEFDNKILRTNGQLQIGNPAFAGTGYKFPTARGTNKQVLETDATGNVSWATPNNSLSVMRVNLNANQTLTTAGWQKINYNILVFDTNSEFAISDNRFTAQKAGFYQINAGYHIVGNGSTNYFRIGVFVNGAEYQETSANHFQNGPVDRNINCIVNLAAGQYVEIFVWNDFSGASIDSYSGKTFFEVSQIK